MKEWGHIDVGIPLVTQALWHQKLTSVLQIMSENKLEAREELLMQR